ncbi:MAG: hypothetical protein GY822_21910 [Deltaproteobacteria bacterium]|nr:hypothetical protein [Deltaproteobacteria bacterium]
MKILNGCAFLVLSALFFASSSAEARNGGIYLEIAPGYGFFAADEVITENGGDGGEDSPPNGFIPQLKLGLNLFGYGGVETDIAGHGWDLTNSTRGGGGYVGGVVRVTPLELLRWVIPDTFTLPSLIPEGPVTWHDRFFDLGLYFGGGYTMVGENYAYSGGYLKYGFDVKFFITPYFAIGLDFSVRQAMYSPFRFTHYEKQLGHCTDGGDAIGGITGGTIEPSTTRSELEEISFDDVDDCKNPAPSSFLFAPAITISGVLDFGI